eukprot:TRINITY_DN33217_c1_g1_i1.p1 TRINITY_DN33217_c1_g1~~TRINITY_DN33217_c1_g1_i1.p1  ORF type:complete len:102 (+),score=2.95 TRINITY_DN33217_c1_g1_i1:69-374(+)
MDFLMQVSVATFWYLFIYLFGTFGYWSRSDTLTGGPRDHHVYDTKVPTPLNHEWCWLVSLYLVHHLGTSIVFQELCIACKNRSINYVAKWIFFLKCRFTVG